MESYVVIVCLLKFALSANSSLENTEKLMAHLGRTDSKWIRPRFNQSDTVEVYIMTTIYMIMDYDVTEGKLTLALASVLEWIDEGKKWNESHFQGISQVSYPMSKLWLPNLYFYIELSGNSVFLSNSDTREEAFINSDGKVRVIVRKVASFFCEPHIIKYPFDKQTCFIQFSPDRDTSKVILKDEIGPQFYSFQGNKRWEFISASHQNNQEFNYSSVDYYISIRRYPVFLALNLIFPIIILVLANPMVFLIPADSGERVSYSITIFLAFIVFVTSISDTLPEVNDPVCIFNLFLIGQLTYSAIIMLIVILLSRIRKTENKECLTLCKDKTQNPEAENDQMKKYRNYNISSLFFFGFISFSVIEIAIYALYIIFSKDI